MITTECTYILCDYVMIGQEDLHYSLNLSYFIFLEKTFSQSTVSELLCQTIVLTISLRLEWLKATFGRHGSLLPHLFCGSTQN